MIVSTYFWTTPKLLLSQSDGEQIFTRLSLRSLIYLTANRQLLECLPDNYSRFSTTPEKRHFFRNSSLAILPNPSKGSPTITMPFVTPRTVT